MDSGFLLAVTQVCQAGDGTFQRDSVCFAGKLSIQKHPGKNRSRRITNLLFLREIKLLALRVHGFKRHRLVEKQIVLKTDYAHAISMVTVCRRYSPPLSNR